MRQYLTGKAGLTRLLTVVLTTSLFILSSCADEFEKKEKDHNFSMDFSTRAGDTSAEQVPYIRLYNFNYGGPTDKVFYKEIVNVTRNQTQGKVTAQVEVGQWNMALVSNPNGGTIIPPTKADVMSKIPMYKYEPTYPTNGKTSDAHEMFLDNIVTPVITSGGAHAANAQLNRTVARVDLIIDKTTPNFDLTSVKHKIKLHNIPSTISYTGDLLPSAAAPDTLALPLESPVKLHKIDNTAYNSKDTIMFIIPAHRGDTYTSANPTQKVGVKMNVTLTLERTGGSFFTKQKTIDVVAECNKILQVKITVNDGLEFKTDIKDWESVGVNSNVGKGYQNWLYVKKGATGNGLSWSDALPNINAALAKAAALQALSPAKTVHGILVAGGESIPYSEALNIPAGIKVYGGWEGVAGTELASNDATAPYTSAARNLKDNKVRLAVGTGNVQIAGANAVLDGFVVSGSGTGGTAGLVDVSAKASINAVEIKGNTAISSNNALALSDGTASNVLVSGNNKSVDVTNNGKLINATVVENTNVAAKISGGAFVYNSIFWPEKVTPSGTNDIQYSAFVGEIASIPAGTGNIHINSTNMAWFSTGVTAPGPHFKMTNDADKYKAGSNRSPILGRGNEVLYTGSLSVLLNKDINGLKRYDTDPQDVNKMLMDIGCYEDQSSLTGFRLTWAADRLYISAKGGYRNVLPLMLPGNVDPETQIAVTWGVNVLSSSTWSDYEGTTINTSDHVVVGTVKFKNPGSTPTGDYKGTSERKWGQIEVTTNLGGYLPDTKIDVYQVPGANTAWQNGYVGSFHRNNEVGARYIHGYNTGNWEARIISGIEWIKIDQLGMNEGEDIQDADEGKTPHGNYYKEVKEVWGGAVKGTGNIKFRVGMKSKNPDPSKPRYGLIVITRAGGSAMFFVRQGEAPDYLYRSGDPRSLKTGGTDANPTYTEYGRLDKYIKKFSTYNVTDSKGRVSNTGTALTRAEAGFTKYPSQLGYYFKWNSMTGFVVNNTTSTSSGSAAGSWSNNREICPAGYRHPTQYEYIYSIYDKAAETTGQVSPSAIDSKNNFAWGAYADGYYDQLAADQLSIAPSSTYAGYYNVLLGTGANIAAKGILMQSHYDYGSVFFPAGGPMNSSGVVDQNATTQYKNYRIKEYVMVWTGGSSEYGGGTNPTRNTHWSWRDGATLSQPHIGMNCTNLNQNGDAGNIRCVKE